MQVTYCAWNDPQTIWKGDCNSWKSIEKSRPFRLPRCWDRPEYWEESWRTEETYCLSQSSESPPPANTRIKNWQEVEILIMIQAR